MKKILVSLVLMIALLVPPVASAAIITLDFASFGGGQVTINFDYNQGNGNIATVDKFG